MFHPEMNPEQVLLRLMKDSIETVENLESAGYPTNAIPPHSSSVYLLSREEDVAYVGLGKSEIEVLTKIDKDLWVPRALFKLDCESDDQHYPIGTFIGFIGSAESVPERLLFFGVLISPSGDDAKGMYIDLQEKDEVYDLWKHPFALAPHLQATYVSTDNSTIH